MPRFEREQSEYIEKVVYLNRVSKLSLIHI